MKDTLVLHHTDISGPDNQYDEVFSYHHRGAGGKWPAGNGISYHYFIEKSGLVLQGRPEESIGYHAGNWIMNVRSIAICLAGNFTREQPTEKQVSSLTRLTTELQRKWGIPDVRILLHREIKQTACPGIDLRPLIFERRETELRQRIAVVNRAVTRTVGPRKQMLIRLLQRLVSLLP